MGLDRAGLAGTSALLTGGGSGIGLAYAQRLAADGASVTICGGSEDRPRAGVEAIPDLSSRLADVFGADGLRGVVGT